MITEKIKYLREELEITQNEIANKLDVTRSAYSLWELNKNVIPLNYLNKISNLYDVNIDYLAGLSNLKTTEFKKVEIDRKELGKRIRAARKSINYTQEMLAAKLNTTHSVISAYENGKTKIPTLFLIEIARLTNKSLNWFLDK